MKHILVLSGLVALVACAASVWVAQAQEKVKRVGAPVGQTDAIFVFKASEMDLAEINIGKVAAERAGSEEVKEYGKQMVTDHTKSSKELLKIANKKRLKVAPKMGPKHEALLQKLLALKGEDFDRAYMMAMAMDHKMAVDLYENQAKNGQDPDLKAFAEKTLPVIRKHLEKAQQFTDDKGEAKKDKDAKGR